MKNKQFLRLVSGALAASMAFTALPVTALATSGVGGGITCVSKYME